MRSWTSWPICPARTWLVGRIRPANRSTTGRLIWLEPRPPLRRLSRCLRAQPTAGLEHRRPRDSRPAGRVARRHAGHRPRLGAGSTSTRSSRTTCMPCGTPAWPTMWPRGRCGSRSATNTSATLVDFLEELPGGLRDRAALRRRPAGVSRRPAVVSGQGGGSPGGRGRVPPPRHLAGEEGRELEA